MTAFHLRGTLLPAGDRVELWVLGDRVSFTRPATVEAVTVVDGGYLTPGLVDVHTHPGHDADGRFTDERFAQECAAHVKAGTTAVRVPGHRGPIPARRRADRAMPRLVTAGQLLAHPSLRSDAPMHTVVEDLTAAALAEAAANDGWCKLIADWERDRPPVPLELMRRTVEAVHAAGGRVAAHCQTAEGTRTAVLAGVDSIEHGWYLTDDLIERLAARGSAFVPTATAFLQLLPDVRDKPEGPRKDHFLGGIAGAARSAVVAHEAGVRVLAGTDSAPFGNVVTEIEWLIGCGLSPTTAIGAASWTAREYLGLPGLVEGGLADVVAYGMDPRREPAALRHPARIILRGRVRR
jgi:imidazolonepropionase-like amidohydrolase